MGIDTVGLLVVIWLGSLAIVFVSGAVLGSITLKFVQRLPKSPTYPLHIMDKFVRILYRGVVILTALHFYISIPILIFLLLFLAITIFTLIGGYRSTASLQGTVTALIFFAYSLFTIWILIQSVFTGLFSQASQNDFGRRLPRPEAPHLWAMTDEVAQRTGTRAIDVIYLIPGVQIAVTEQGGFWHVLIGRGVRCLILGLGALEGMTQDQLKAILAHEYGHFNNRDTAGGDLSLPVQTSIQEIGLAMMRSTKFFPTGMVLMSPAWLYVYIYLRVFLLSTCGASRLQEILADRYAAAVYGPQNLINGLTQIVRQMVLFDHAVTVEIQQAIAENRKLKNLYTLSQNQSPDLDSGVKQKLEQEVETKLNRPASRFDTHPALTERIRLVKQLDIPDPPETNTEPIWGLFSNAEALQLQMTQQVFEQVQRQVRMGRFKPKAQ